MKMKKILLFCLIIVSFAALPVFASDEVAYDMTAEEFIDANWQKAFVTGKTSYQIQGRMVSQPTDVYNPLELVSYHVENDGESVILTGTLGEEWVAPVSKVVNTYTKTDGTVLTAEDFTSSLDTPLTLQTIAEIGTNYALQVPSDVVVRVDTAWGDVLYTNASDAPHGEGDYLVCNNVDGNPDLSDVWVVNGAVFPSTYDMSKAE